MELTWLQSITDKWLARLEQGRVPHAVLLLGPVGTGKRATAVWMAKQRLGFHDCGALPVHPFVVPEHADLRWVGPPEDKHTVGVDQVRTLINELNLTSYEGGSKVAIIESAHAMTINAANSLLKTLEEPPGDALIVLVADRVGRLPATVFSRCQRINFNRPAASASLAWLDRLQPGTGWQKSLEMAGGAPLAAIKALQQLPDTDSMGREFADLANNRAAPLTVAARWAKYEPRFVLDWLCVQVQWCIHRHSGITGSTATGQQPVLPNSVLHRIDRRNLFCYLDTINRLRAQATGSFNVHLTFEGLLIDWAEGLSDVARPGSMDNVRMSFMGG
jgi:DNA polymerase III subunit delta'